MMKPEFLKEVLEKIKSVKIAIIGDFCLDAYWFIDKSKSEISIETGRPTEPVSQQKYSLGGAGNVASNLIALEISDIRALGVIGNDPFGVEMISKMNQTGINTVNMLVQEKNWSTHVYIKPHIGDTEQNRIDFGNFNILSDVTADILIENLRKESKEVDLIIINQQVLSGIHTEYFRLRLKDVINQYPEKIFIADSRNYSDDYKGAYRKMNDSEAVMLCGIFKESDDNISHSEVVYAAERLFEKFRKPLFITRGARGSVVTDDKGISEIGGLMILSRTDTVGAGDSYLAGAAAALAAGYSIMTAGEMGTFTAGVTVQKLFQTGTASPGEILNLGSDPDYIYRPEIAEDIRQAVYYKKSEIEIINKWPADLSIRYAIFDNDGTISTLREGWEHIMAPMMIKAILGEKYHEADPALYAKVKKTVTELIDKTTGVQTLRQMQLLIALIRESGIVPEDKILDESGYKEIYNHDLLEMVKKREEKLRTGELSVDDFTIKNSIPFLGKFYDKGIKLYLTSGTDEADVRHEAAILGYDHFFEGRIFGALGDINKEAKKMVLERILSSIGDSEAASIVTFGDGPVEIRETCKRGGRTAGVASSELRRYGLNEAKRTRLIKAGADIVFPDFSQPELLYQLLNIN
jgi:bifunctional ADP-heptose synthase (sugar kinase/adenylyltransferase)/phosphoglycolate phosphatase-like HAD superfamily hydrolase